MIVGPLINSLAVLVGGIVGATLGRYIPKRVRQALPAVFGLASMSMGVVMLARAVHMPVLIIALLVGATLGELLRIEQAIGAGASRVRRWLDKRATGASGVMPEVDDTFVDRYVTVVILFCASGTGVFGALQEGMTGDFSVLAAKGFLDLFGAVIFASTLGLAVAAIAVPQLVIQMALALSAVFIIPLTNDVMRADFSAVGGVLMLASGLRICGILNLPIANLLPALVLAMPVSWLWVQMF